LEFALKYGGDPARYGAPAPNADITKAGFTGSAHYLNLVAEDRLKPRPWISKIEGDIVTFTNGDEAQADAIILGTGFALNLPFLSDEISDTVGLTDQGMELSNFTFHPDLPGLAFVGLWAQNGGYFTPIEQQARYVSYVWSDTVECDDLDAGLQVCLTEQHHVGYREQNEMALRFAKLSQTDPLSKIDDDLTELVMQSATTGLLFRLVGPQSIEDAQDRLRRQFARFGPQKNR
jgi:dimethylaniline monooxygenase (N-oxide forming)